MKNKVLFLYKDGALIKKHLMFYPWALSYLGRITNELDYKLVMILTKESMMDPYNLKSKNELFYDKFYFDSKDYTNNFFLLKYSSSDLYRSYLVSNRIEDVFLAKKIGIKFILLIQKDKFFFQEKLNFKKLYLHNTFQTNDSTFKTNSWKEIYKYLKFGRRKCKHKRITTETDVEIYLNLDGKGIYDVYTGLGFFDHMLEQISRHANLDMIIKVKGDHHVDEHHTIEDTGIALGSAFSKNLYQKLGINRFGFMLPMDDTLAQVSIDFGGRSYFVCKTHFIRERIGSVPSEMFSHFLKSFSDAANCSINVQATGVNEHHKIEAIFKAFAHALKKAIFREINNITVPSTKGII